MHLSLYDRSRIRSIMNDRSTFETDQKRLIVFEASMFFQLNFSRLDESCQ